MKFIRYLPILLYFSVVWGCSTLPVDSTPPVEQPEPQAVLPVAPEPAPSPEAPPEIPQTAADELNLDCVLDDPPKAYYAAEDRLPLYPQARFADPTCELPLNEKLIRYKVQNGFAFVEVQSLSLTGWVDNGKLDWKQAEFQAPPETGGEQLPAPLVPEVLPETPEGALGQPYPMSPAPAEDRQTSIQPNF